MWYFESRQDRVGAAARTIVKLIDESFRWNVMVSDESTANNDDMLSSVESIYGRQANELDRGFQSLGGVSISVATGNGAVRHGTGAGTPHPSQAATTAASVALHGTLQDN